VDEEFYGYMPAQDDIPYTKLFRQVEHHKVLVMAHSMGARSGQFEKNRPTLGAIATSLAFNPSWRERLKSIQQQQQAEFQRKLAQGYANIAAAAQMSKMISAQNDAFLHNIEAQRQASNASLNRSAAGTRDGGFDQRMDDVDQFIRGTEHMVDQNGVVSDQYTDYNYHWTDGFGRYVHTDDPNLDPNQYLTGNYQKMTPLH